MGARHVDNLLDVPLPPMPILHMYYISTYIQISVLVVRRFISALLRHFEDLTRLVTTARSISEGVSIAFLSLPVSERLL